MKLFSTSLRPKVTLIPVRPSISLAEDSTERKGLNLGILERAITTFTVLLSDDNPPAIEGNAVYDGSFRCVAEDTTKFAIRIEKTPGDERVGDYGIRVDDVIATLPVRGTPTIWASGPDCCIVQLPPDSAIGMVSRDGKRVVLFNERGVSMPKCVMADAYFASFSPAPAVA